MWCGRDMPVWAWWSSGFFSSRLCVGAWWSGGDTSEESSGSVSDGHNNYSTVLPREIVDTALFKNKLFVNRKKKWHQTFQNFSQNFFLLKYFLRGEVKVNNCDNVVARKCTARPKACWHKLAHVSWVQGCEVGCAGETLFSLEVLMQCFIFHLYSSSHSSNPNPFFGGGWASKNASYFHHISFQEPISPLPGQPDPKERREHGEVAPQLITRRAAKVRLNAINGRVSHTSHFDPLDFKWLFGISISTVSVISALLPLAYETGDSHALEVYFCGTLLFAMSAMLLDVSILYLYFFFISYKNLS